MSYRQRTQPNKYFRDPGFNDAGNTDNNCDGEIDEGLLKKAPESDGLEESLNAQVADGDLQHGAATVFQRHEVLDPDSDVEAQMGV